MTVRPSITSVTRPGSDACAVTASDAAISADGRVAGCYVYGLFGADAFRRAYLAGFGAASDLAYEARVEATLDALADHLERHLDLDRMLDIARSR